MQMIDISKKYRDLKNGYINISVLNDYISELFDNNYIVANCEFLKVNKKWTQPFMEYSLRKEWWYKKEELISEINKIKKIVFSKWFKEGEIFFDIWVLNYLK